MMGETGCLTTVHVKRWRALPEVSHVSLADAQRPGTARNPELIWRRLVAPAVRSQPNLNPTSTLSHYPPGIPPSLAEAQPCAGLSSLSVRRRSSTTGTISQRRIHLVQRACNELATSDALKSMISRCPRCQHCQGDGHYYHCSAPLTHRAPANRPGPQPFPSAPSLWTPLNVTV